MSQTEAIVLIGVGLVAIVPIRFFYRRRGKVLRFIGGGISSALMGAALSSGTVRLLSDSISKLNFNPPGGMTKSQFITLIVASVFFLINIIRSIGSPARLAQKKGKSASQSVFEDS